MSEKYVSKTDILQWVQKIDAKVTDISDHIMNKGHAWVDRTLTNMRVYKHPTTSDAKSFLKMAASCFILSLLCKNRIITQTTGELATDKFGDVAYQFQRTQPMFFFATGSSEPFQRLLPYETFRMMAVDFCRAYKQYYKFYKKRGLERPIGRIIRDKTSRGNYWNESVSTIETADSQYGDIVDSDFNRKDPPYWA